RFAPDLSAPAAGVPHEFFQRELALSRVRRADAGGPSELPPLPDAGRLDRPATGPRLRRSPLPPLEAGGHPRCDAIPGGGGGVRPAPRSAAAPGADGTAAAGRRRVAAALLVLEL